MLLEVGEFLRLHAWKAMPVLLGLTVLWHWRRDNRAGLTAIMPLCLVWLAATTFAALFHGDETWAVFAVIDAVAALATAFLAVETGPRKAMAFLTFSFAAEVAIHTIYGGYQLLWGERLLVARIDYWSTFAIALWQISIAARQGGQRGKRRGRAVVYRSDVDRGDCFGGVRLADRFSPVRARG